jgi:hypothetical protein
MILTKGLHEIELSVQGGTIVRWQYGEVDVLYPQRRISVRGELKLRGGIPICVPIHGKPPDERWLQGFGIPQHGFVRDQQMEYVRRESSASGQMNLTHVGSGVFPWGFLCAETPMVTEEGVYHSLVVMRLKEHDQSKFPGTPEGGMPVAPGIHPYFSTPRGVWGLAHGKRTLHNTGLRKGESQVWPLVAGESVRLRTSLGTVRFVPQEPYQELVIWTDSEYYVCVEPRTRKEGFGTPEGIALCEDLESLDLSCYFTFEPA